ncbi:hypothetical protein ACLGIH_17485 [Streptomyces sp. HMX87]|uniref:hypothetical protein n=1 Tax=Streptomyces sp. HMX87 TaxID=3390849 RepID=UPI003A8A5108
MTGTGVEERGAQAARSRALAVLRIRSRALAVALLPAAAAVILLAGGSTGHLTGAGWDAARWAVGVLAFLVLLATAGIALVVARARPAVSPTVPIAEDSAPDLYRMVRDLADRLDVPAPSAIALTPDCDSWLEDRTHPAHGPPPEEPADLAGLDGPAHRRSAAAPVLVIGSPFLWWMRVGELRAVLAPVVAGTGPSAHPDIAAARRFVRGLDAAVAVASAGSRRPLSRAVSAGVGRVVRLLLHSCRVHAAEMERGVAAAAAERAQAVDYGLRIVAQEQVGLAYAGWDRLLTRVALPAWRMGRWPSRLDAGVVAALTELSRRDRLAEGFTSRLGERPACDLLEEPGAVDEAASLLAARLFHGGPAESGPDWAPVEWHEYPEEVVDRTWRTDAARLHRVLDAMGVRRTAAHTVPGAGAADVSAPDSFSTTDRFSAPAHFSTTDRFSAPAHFSDSAAGADGPGAEAPTLARVLDHLADPTAPPPVRTTGGPTAHDDHGSHHDGPAPTAEDREADETGRRPDPAHAHTARPDALTDNALTESASAENALPENTSAEDVSAETALPEGTLGAEDELDEDGLDTTPRGAALAAGLSAELAREEAGAGGPASSGTGPGGATASAAPPAPPVPPGPDPALWDDRALPLFPPQPPRSGRELLADHITAMVCCAAMDTAGATPCLDWLDGPSLLIGGERAADLAPRVLSLVETGDAGPLRAWLAEQGIRPEKPVRLV